LIKLKRFTKSIIRCALRLNAKKNFLVPKIDFLWKHARKRQARVGGHGLAMGKFYFVRVKAW
jgi:hypothetical protein